MQLEGEKVDELEPFYGREVAAELCGCTVHEFDHFIYRHAADIEKHFYHNGTPGTMRRRVYMRSQVIEIRKRMFGGQVNVADLARRSSKVRLNRKKKINKWETPSALFLLSNNE